MAPYPSQPVYANPVGVKRENPVISNQLVYPPLTYINPVLVVQNPIVISVSLKPVQIGNQYPQTQIVAKDVPSPMET